MPSRQNRDDLVRKGLAEAGMGEKHHSSAPRCQQQHTRVTLARSPGPVRPPAELGGFYEKVMTAVFRMLAESGLACGVSPDEAGAPALDESDEEEHEDEPMAPLASNTEDLGSDEDNLSTGQDP